MAAVHSRPEKTPDLRERLRPACLIPPKAAHAHDPRLRGFAPDHGTDSDGWEVEDSLFSSRSASFALKTFLSLATRQ